MSKTQMADQRDNNPGEKQKLRTGQAALSGHQHTGTGRERKTGVPGDSGMSISQPAHPPGTNTSCPLTKRQVQFYVLGIQQEIRLKAERQ